VVTVGYATSRIHGEEARVGGHARVSAGDGAREYQPHLFIEDLVALRELFLKDIGRADGSSTAS